MNFRLFIIGDEILSGKREDKHFAKTIQILAARGLKLSDAHYLGDDPLRITAALKRSFESEDVVFSCGGIGATPDDHTRTCVAQALNVPLLLHPQAQRLITERTEQMEQERAQKTGEPAQAIDMGAPHHLLRLKMGEFPQGAQIIPNPYNKIPGFSVQRHYFVPGFPVMAWPMIEWVLDTHYAACFKRENWLEKSVIVYGSMESTLTPLMEAVEAQFPTLRVFSLPSMGEAGTRNHIELGVKGKPEEGVDAAYLMLKNGARALFRHQESFGEELVRR